MATFLLETTDNKQIAVDSVVIRESNVLNGFETTNTNEAIPVAVSSTALNRIKTFCNFFKDAPAYVKAKNFREQERLPNDSEAVKWMASLEFEELIELTEAIDLLNMPRLTDHVIYFMLIVEAAETKKLRQDFGVRNDFL